MEARENTAGGPDCLFFYSGIPQHRAAPTDLLGRCRTEIYVGEAAAAVADDDIAAAFQMLMAFAKADPES